MQSYTSVLPREPEALGTERQAGVGGCLDRAGGDGGHSPILGALLKYLACPEGTREPWKGSEQGIKTGRMTMCEDPGPSRTTARRLGAAGNGGPQLQQQSPSPPSSSPYKLAGSVGISSRPRGRRLLTRNNRTHRSLVTEHQTTDFRPRLHSPHQGRSKSQHTTRKTCKVLISLPAQLSQT